MNVIDSIGLEGQSSPLSSFMISPQRVVWKSEQGVSGSDHLLKKKPGQATLVEGEPTILESTVGNPAGVLIDFGSELQGYLEIIVPATGGKVKRRARVRFGESASEAMSELGGEQNAVNDHAMRDQEIELPWLGKKMVGPSGFRFVRIDNLEPEVPLHLVEVRAILQIRDLPYLGSFESDDERINQIWKTGAYTVHLNMQEYLWDGIKRDRLVWVGDLHPEVCTINAVFGYNQVVSDSLDLVRNITPPTEWMNTISSYSMWWILIHEEQYQHHGNLDYLKEQKAYLKDLLEHLMTFVDDDGKENFDGFRFLDWPTSKNKEAVHEGLHALLSMTLDKGAGLMDVLNEKEISRKCLECGEKLRSYKPKASGRKAPAALMALAGLKDASAVCSDILKVGGTQDLSTFYGYYVLKALAEGGEIDSALEMISEYWGGMLDLGATTFWEDFDLSWTENSGRIDELTPEGKKDIHGDFGAHCYRGFRHSFCHGWASGPTAWLSRYVLGVSPAEPGFSKVKIQPSLGHLQEVKGSYPTPKGVIKVFHRKTPDGVESEIELPEGVVQVKS